MHRSIMLGALLMLTLRGPACDVCGLYLGLQPHDRVNNFGLWYRMRYLHGDVRTSTMGLLKHGGHAHTVSGSAEYTEVFMVAEARGEVWLGQRFRIMASVPVVNNYASMDGVRIADIYASGDPLLMGRYVLFNTRCNDDSTKTRHRLTIGAGAKLPLGRHDLTWNGETLDHDLQPGTGTWDALLSLEYLVRGRAWGIGTSAIARLNGTAGDGHSMGPGLSSTAEVFRIREGRVLMWMPSLGVYHELAMQDRQDDRPVDGTGTSVLFSHLSTRLWWRSFGLSLTWQHAFAQNNGDMMVPNRERFIAGLTYNLNNN
jgi:hypothetical protein